MDKIGEAKLKLRFSLNPKTKTLKPKSESPGEAPSWSPINIRLSLSSSKDKKEGGYAVVNDWMERVNSVAVPPLKAQGHENVTGK